MKESIGLTVTINIFIVFLLVAFIFVAGILSYTKAFKAASIVIKQLERYEGYNSLAMDGIDKDLGTIGIIGPKRMDYSKVISVMKYISNKLNTNKDSNKNEKNRV